MPAELVDVSPPPAGIYRISRRTVEPFAPPTWAFVDPETGTFGNRFDDPGQINGVPEHERFRVISCATSKTGAFGEVLAHLRPSLGVISQISRTTRDTGRRTIEALAGVVNPQDASARLLDAGWRERRQIGHVVLNPSSRFADVTAAASLSYLRGVPDLARLALDLGLADIDMSALSSPVRSFTQACSRHIHDLFDDQEAPRFAGIRYMSRHGAEPAWECWALFDDRLRLAGPPTAVPIEADDPHLLAVANLYHLSIETDGNGLIRPWRE